MPLFRYLGRPLLFLAASISLSSQSLTEHPINECFDHEFSTFNASASVHIPPLSQNITNSSLATWKLGTAVKETFRDDKSIIKQKWWLEGDSSLPSNASLSPIDGCIIYLQASPNNTFRGKGAADNSIQNGCSKVITPECQNAMLNWVSWNITSYSDKDLDNHWTICAKIARLLWQPPKECKADYHLESISLQTFGNPDFIAPAENGCNDTDFDIFEGSATRNSFLELPSPPSPIGDHKTYDQIIETTDPFLLVSWPRNRTQGWFPDAQLACLTPSETINNGSRVPGSKAAEASKQNTASTGVGQESVFALWMLLLVVILIL